MHWLSEYETATPGVEAYDNATNILGEQSEPQPDACLLIAPTKGGQTRSEDDYIVGAPELIVEVASGMESGANESLERLAELLERMKAGK